MIPKVIHYCWFGENPLPQLAQRCIASWRKNCPDYEIKEWNESNFDFNCCTFAKEAYAAQKWAFLSDWARLHIIYNEGGIYLDTDVELIKSLDEMLKNKCFLAEETSGYVNTGLGFGAEKYNPIVGKLLQEYLNVHFVKENGSYDIIPCPQKNTKPLLELGYKFSGVQVWRIAEVTIYPPEYFCPLNYETGILKKTSKTISIHLYNASWHNNLEKIIIKIENGATHSSLEYKFRRALSLPLRILNKIYNIGIINTLRGIKEKIKI